MVVIDVFGGYERRFLGTGSDEEVVPVCRVVGVGQLPSHLTKEGDGREQHLPKTSRRAQPDHRQGELAVPEQMIVSMAEIAESAKEGLLALAVGTGLQVMAAMFGEKRRRAAVRAGGQVQPRPEEYWHGSEAGSVTLGGGWR